MKSRQHWLHLFVFSISDSFIWQNFKMLASKVPATPAELVSTLKLSPNEALNEQITKWIMWDRNAATVQQVVDAVNNKDWEALRIRLCNYNKFAVAGMRSGMRAGFDSINDLVSIQVAQGLCQYLIKMYPSIAKREAQGVVIGFDCRYNGKRFAQLMASVFLNNNFRVNLFNRMVPTPFIAFSVLKLKCMAGIVVTGSHDMKSDNGFKIFWSNGALILPPHEKNIYDAMMKHMEPVPSSWDLNILEDHNLLVDPYREVYAEYYEDMKRQIPEPYMETNECSQLRFIYTPLHGVGFHYIREGFYHSRLKPVIPVVQQRDPDPEFPTIQMPDPLGKNILKSPYTSMLALSRHTISMNTFLVNVNSRVDSGTLSDEYTYYKSSLLQSDWSTDFP